MNTPDYTPPWLTVATVVRNDPQALIRTVSSVASQQTSLLEHLIIDGDSDDGTRELALAAAVNPWVRVFSEPDRSVYNAMNKAINLAEGTHILFLNAGDDFTAPTVVSQLTEDVQREGYDWGRYRARFVDDERNSTRPLPPAACTREDFYQGTAERYHQGAVMSRDMLLNLGGFNERFSIVADYDLMCRALQQGYEPWVSEDIITNYDASGLSRQKWRRSLQEEHEVRQRILNPTGSLSGAVSEYSRYASRVGVVSTKRALREVSERLLGASRVSALRGRSGAAE